jgi:hypothetical protein
MNKVSTLFHLLIFHGLLEQISNSEICLHLFLEDMKLLFTNFYSDDNLAVYI